MISCSKPALQEETPEERLREARIDYEKHRYEKAYETLEGLRLLTAGTRLGGEVLFLMGETGFKNGKYPEAESHYAAYLNSYPGGPFAEQALYQQALSKVKQLQKRKIGFFTFRTYIPHDRDISLLRESRVLFEIYLEKYPEGASSEGAARWAADLLVKEGEHELQIASYYLRKNRPRSAMARAEFILEGKYPDRIKDEARELIKRAERSLADTGDNDNY